MINKDPIRVGGEDGLDPTTLLPMYRRFTTFEGSRDQEYLKIYYEQWIESNGAKLEFKIQHYVVIDHPEMGHFEDDTWVVDFSYAPMFTFGWYNRVIQQAWVGLTFGEQVIVGAINDTLINHIPYNAGKEFFTSPATSNCNVN